MAQSLIGKRLVFEEELSVGSSSGSSEKIRYLVDFSGARILGLLFYSFKVEESLCTI
jgi:hypothetical protein